MKKRCRKCQIVKDASSFYQCLRRKDKLQSYCKLCHAKDAKEWMHKMPEEYGLWKNMRQRCSNYRHRRFPRYGGRGIKVCERWEKSFDAFLADMGKRPTRKHQIDRIDNNGNYEPGNCRWVFQVENIRNSISAKINVQIAKEIKDKLAKGISSWRIALDYNVSKHLISHIKTGKTWKEV